MNKDTFIMRTKIIEGGEGVAQEILDVSCLVIFNTGDILYFTHIIYIRSCMTTLLCQNLHMQMDIKNQ
jgi:hypothetical protein